MKRMISKSWRKPHIVFLSFQLLLLHNFDPITCDVNGFDLELATTQLTTATALKFEVTSSQFESTTEEYEGLICLYKQTDQGYACDVTSSNVRRSTEVSAIDGEVPEQSVTFVYSTDAHLEVIPEIIFVQFEELSRVVLCNVGLLVMNQLRSCSSLTYLNLDDNELDNLRSKTFENCQNLREIHLSGNAIDSFDSQAFDGLEKLEILYIKSSQIKVIAGGWMYYMSTHWRHLSGVSELQISLIRPIDFVKSLQAMTNLEKLNLKFNRLRAITDDTFVNLWKLKELSVNKNEIATISGNAFASLTMLTSLDLSDNKLIIFPPAFQALKVITLINLDNNAISSLNQLMDLPRIETMSVVDNQVRSINLRLIPSSINNLKLAGNICIDKNFLEIQDFEREVKLQLKNCFDHFVKETFCIFHETRFGYSCKLILDHETNQEIDELERSHLIERTDNDVNYLFLKFKSLKVALNIVFEKFINLETVEWWATSIEALDPITSCLKLKTVDLRINNLTKLVDETFVKCREVSSLILMKNRLSLFEEKAFHGLHKLNFLDLSTNEIKEIPEKIFEQLEKLKTLKISHNQLKSLNWITGLSSLQILILSYNEIESTNLDTFITLSSLQELHLNSNKIVDLQAQSEVFPNLFYLNVEDNKLSVLNINAESFPKLQYLDISKNEIVSITSDLKAFRFLLNFHAIGNLCVDQSFVNIENFNTEVLPEIFSCVQV